MKSDLWRQQLFLFWTQSFGYALFFGVLALALSVGLFAHLRIPWGGVPVGIVAFVLVLTAFHYLLRANSPVERLWHGTPAAEVFAFAERWATAVGYEVASRGDDELRLRQVKLREAYEEQGRQDPPPSAYDIVLRRQGEESVLVVGPAKDTRTLLAAMEELLEEEYAGEPAPVEEWQGGAALPERDEAGGELPPPSAVFLFGSSPPLAAPEPRDDGRRRAGGESGEE